MSVLGGSCLCAMFNCCDACSGGYNHFGFQSLFGRMLRCAIVCTYGPCHPGYGRCLFVKYFAHDPWPPCLVTFSVLMSFSSMRKYLYYTLPPYSTLFWRMLWCHDRWPWTLPPGLSVCYGLAVAVNWPISNMFGQLIWCNILCVFEHVRFVFTCAWTLGGVT